MKHAVFGSSMMLVAVAAMVGCSAPPMEDPSRSTMCAEISITSDPNKGLAGVVIGIGNDLQLATTDERGRASVTLKGVEGDTVDLAVRCPGGYQSPAPIHVGLRRLSPGSPAPRFEARCAPIQRNIVVGIRAENGANLPVQHLGKVVAQTDASGVAHVVVQARANEQLTFLLDTKSTERKPALKPENPTLTFVAKDRDELVVLDQKFEQEKLVVKAAAPRPSGPQRL